MSWQNAKRHLGVMASAALAWSLLPAFDCLGAESGGIKLGLDDGYGGEIEVNTNPPPCTGGSICDDRHCAHGFGHLFEERGKEYEGTFVHGCPDGFGTYQTDEFTYVGGLKMGRFNGHGKMTCFGDSRVFEGEFVDDTFAGKPFDRWNGLCR
jgi:hypothetical protein